MKLSLSLNVILVIMCCLTNANTTLPEDVIEIPLSRREVIGPHPGLRYLESIEDLN